MLVQCIYLLFFTRIMTLRNRNPSLVFCSHLLAFYPPNYNKTNSLLLWHKILHNFTQPKNQFKPSFKIAIFKLYNSLCTTSILLSKNPKLFLGCLSVVSSIRMDCSSQSRFYWQRHYIFSIDRAEVGDLNRKSTFQ